MNNYPQPHTGVCPECSAPAVDGMPCWGMLGAIIAWEAQDAALLAEHFLSVASYNLQHPAQFTGNAIVGLRAVFIDHLDHGVPVAEVRRRVGHLAGGSARVLKRESERLLVRRQWRMTIADVYLPDHPRGAAERVRAWAAATRKEL